MARASLSTTLTQHHSLISRLWHLAGTQAQLVSHFDHVAKGLDGRAALGPSGAADTGPGSSDAALLEAVDVVEKKGHQVHEDRRHRSVHALPELSKEDMLLVGLLDCRDIEYLEVRASGPGQARMCVV